MQQVNLGLIGGGTVGGGVYQALERHGDLLARRLGTRLTITRVAVRDLTKSRSVRFPASLLTTDWRSIVQDPQVHVVVELMGGVTLAREVVRAALQAGLTACATTCFPRCAWRARTACRCSSPRR